MLGLGRFTLRLPYRFAASWAALRGNFAAQAKGVVVGGDDAIQFDGLSRHLRKFSRSAFRGFGPGPRGQNLIHVASAFLIRVFASAASAYTTNSATLPAAPAFTSSRASIHSRSSVTWEMIPTMRPAC